MATVTASKTWVSGETVSPAGLNLTAAPTVVVADNEVTTAKILDANVTTAKIADANVTNAKLASDIDASKLTTGTLPIARIADDAVTNDKLSLAANAGEIKKALNADNAPPIFACRAWVRFNGRNDSSGAASSSNTNRQILESGNVSSVLRNSQGTYTITFSTAMPDANYCVVGNAGDTTFGVPSISIAGSASQTASSVQIRSDAGNNSIQDSSICCVAIFR
jgi:hypothetical protein